jgi:outer membrane protein OmpA-like peptidoglycan-associated protein
LGEQAREQEAAARQREAAAREQAASIARAPAEQDATLATQQAELARRQAQLLADQLRDLQARETERGLVLTLGDVLFDTGKATLKPGANSTISRLAQFLRQSPERSVTIEGHTDSVGTDSYNLMLSESRAGSVRDALVAQGIENSRILAVGKGESTPVASNDGAAGRQQNRRVEIIISNPTKASANL